MATAAGGKMRRIMESLGNRIVPALDDRNLVIGEAVELVNERVDFGFKGRGVGSRVGLLRREDAVYQRGNAGGGG